MEADKYISKGAAGGVIAVAVVVVFAVSAQAVQEEAGSVVAMAITEALRESAAADTTMATDDTSTAPSGTTATSTTAAGLDSSATVEGRASYYGYRFEGRPTANGEPFDPMGMTAAHRTLPFGSWVRVTNTVNGRSVVVRINDRGPYIRGRIIDLSRGAAERIGMIRSGTAVVTVEVLP